MWLVRVGRIYGCGCKEVYRFPHITYPYSSCICSFLQQHPYFLFILKKFFVLLKEEERRRRMPNHNFFTLHGAHVNFRYSEVIHSFHCKSAVEHDGGV